jgi:hypothetical protein
MMFGRNHRAMKPRGLELDFLIGSRDLRVVSKRSSLAAKQTAEPVAGQD